MNPIEKGNCPWCKKSITYDGTKIVGIQLNGKWVPICREHFSLIALSIAFNKILNSTEE